MSRMAYDPSDRHFNEVLYVTGQENDQWFIPGNNNEGDNPDSGSMANRLDDCEALVGIKQKASDTDPDVQMGKAVKPNSLADW